MTYAQRARGRLPQESNLTEAGIISLQIDNVQELLA